MIAPWRRSSFETVCTIEVEHTNESLHAHVGFDEDVTLGPGDRVRVGGAPVQVPFGETLRLRRRAVVTRANWLERAWTRLAAHFELTELYEVSFSSGRRL